MDWIGIGALVALAAAFYAVRRIPAFIVVSSAVVAMSAAASYRTIAPSAVGDWLELSSGLAMLAFGLLVVRVMLLRSVSLHLLARVDGPGFGSFGEDIAGRLDDLRRFGLVRRASGRVELTAFGRLIAMVVGALGGAVGAMS